MVLTYKGEDVADTILRFAREYRVGHIVIGSPGPLPLVKRLLGKKNVVERLIEKAGGITIVVLDTRQYQVHPGRVPANISEQVGFGRDGSADAGLDPPCSSRSKPMLSGDSFDGYSSLSV
jgi:two-component system sensor histidine kinase KdpD